jgi:hypothetical protein
MRFQDILTGKEVIMRSTTCKCLGRKLQPGSCFLKFVGISICLALVGPALLAQEQLPVPQTQPGPHLTLNPQRVFRLESEATLRERMAREALDGNNPVNLKYQIAFPDSLVMPIEGLPVRQWPLMSELADPAFVCYRRLYFQQIDFERYGWGLGLVTPFLSQGAFYVDLFTLPYHIAMEPLRRYECNTGYYLPGDPAPPLLYLPQPSLYGALGEAAVIGLAIAIFP